MAIAERIQQYVQKLPVAFQAEVLDFVEYLLVKLERESPREEERAWSSMSVSLAMRDMEDEETPVYTSSDLKVVFS